MERNRTEWREKEEALTQNSSGSSRTSPVSSRLSLLSFSLSTNAPSPPRQSQRLKRKIFFFWVESACMRRDPPYSKLPLPVSTSPVRDKTRTVSNDPFPKDKLPPWLNMQPIQKFFFSARWDSWVCHQENISMNTVEFKGIGYSKIMGTRWMANVSYPYYLG